MRDALRTDREVLATLLSTAVYVNANYKSVKNKGVQLVQGHTNGGRIRPPLTSPDWRWNLTEQPLEFPKGERAGVLTHPAGSRRGQL